MALKRDYKFYTDDALTADDICDAIDVYELSKDPKARESAKDLIIAGWIQNQVRIEKNNTNINAPETDAEIDDVALKDLFEQDEKLKEVISQARKIYMNHKKSKK